MSNNLSQGEQGALSPGVE